MLILVVLLVSLVVLVAITELAAAAVPILIVITFVPPDERDALARLLASVDSSPRLRLWPALRLAAAARRAGARPRDSDHRPAESAAPPPSSGR